MIDDPEQQIMPPPEKLILPAPPEPPAPPILSNPRGPQVRPEWLIQRHTSPPPRGLFARVRYFWQKDPAYKVLMVAVAVVLVAGLLLTTLATRAFLLNPNLFRSGYSSAAVEATPAGTVDLRPTFPTPGGGQGSTSSSQPPAQNTPALQPTVTQQPNPTPQPGGLTVQITSIPTRVQNGTTVPVGVTTSGAGVTVWLSVMYDASPFRGYAGPRITDGNGFATIPWTVNVFGAGRHVLAVVTAYARDQQGQQTSSQPVVVQITAIGGGGG